MGCDIHSYIEHKQNGVWEQVTNIIPLDEIDQRWEKRTHGDSPFSWRSYSMFGFLADVRNYSHVPVIAEPHYKIPDDVSEVVRSDYEDWEYGAHTATWLTVKQLNDFDYDQVFWDRRVTKNGDGAALADEGEGAHLSIREFLGEAFFNELAILTAIDKDPENVRVVFWFDS